MHIDENILIKKYERFLKGEVAKYCVSMQLPTQNIHFQDLLSEASIAFLLVCRSFNLDSYDLNAYQYVVVKNKIRSTLRVAMWKIFNMGGYNNRKIDYERNIVVSDILSNESDSIDDAVYCEFNEDFSDVEVSDFINQLSKKDADLLIKIMAGYTPVEIGKSWGNNHRVVSQRLNKIRKLYFKYYEQAA